jgi:type I restriction enzyme, R subunit
LMGLIDAEERAARLETDFEDQFGIPEALALNALDINIDREAYHKKVEAFIHAHLKHPVIQKLRLAQPLTQADLRTLEEFLFNARELESRATFEWAYGTENNLGRFIRSLVGLDRVAAKTAFGTYLDGKTFSSDQILFVNFIIDALTHNGTMSQQALFEAPFTDIHTQGINGLFNPDQVQALLATLNQLNTIETKPMLG